MNIAFNTAVSGMMKAQEKLGQAAANIADPNNLDSLPRDIVSMKTAKIENAANAAVVKTASEMTERLLDIKA